MHPLDQKNMIYNDDDGNQSDEEDMKKYRDPANLFVKVY